MIVDPTAPAPTTAAGSTAAGHTATGAAPGSASAGGASAGGPGGAERPCSWRQLKKQQTREAIHLAAYALVADRGYAHVTVADICAGANVSDRTFFNYFPSKAAATLGLPGTTVSAEVERRFLGSTGPLVGDLCEVVAHLADDGDDHLARIRTLVKCEPDLFAALHQWTSGLRHDVLALAERRTTPVRARLAVSLVFSAMNLHADSSYTTRPPTADSLRETVGRLAAIAAE